MSPKVTIYLVNHNYAKFIQQAIESVLSQTYNNYELIIIDDGSTDHSRDILNKYENIENIKIIYQKNKGLIITNNIALGLANGEYIIRLDGDDWLDANALEIMVNHLDKNSSSALIFPDYYEVDESGEIIRVIRRHNFNDVTLFDQPAHGACTMFKTKILKELGGYDENFKCQDGYDIWLKIITKYSVKNINLPLFHYRQHNKSLSSNRNLILNTRSKILEKNINKLNKHKNIISIVPIRGNLIDSQSCPFNKILGKNLIDWTIESLLKVKNNKYLIITTPDKNIIKYLMHNYGNLVVPVLRDQRLAKLNENYDESIISALNYIRDKNKLEEFLYIIACIESPFRKNNVFMTAIDSLLLFDTDCVVPVLRDDKNFYKHTGHGLKQINNNNVMRLEGSEIYREAGDFRVYNYKGIKNMLNPKETKIGHIIIDQFTSFSVANDHGWDTADILAEKFINNI